MTAPESTPSSTVEPLRPSPEGSSPDGLKVRAHPALCEGWGNCHRWAPEVYPLDDDGQIDIHMLEVPAELAEAAWTGAQVCPAKAISVLGERPPTSTSTPPPSPGE